MDYKYYRFKNNDDKTEDTNPLSIKLRKITGYGANDYNRPVIKEGGEIVDIIADESEFKGHYSFALIILSSFSRDTRLRKETELEQLVKKYHLKNIHFTDIFGKKKILRKSRNQFLEEYTAIVKDITKACISISKSKEGILKDLGLIDASNEEIYFTLFWTNFESIISPFPDNSIFHLFCEMDFSLEDSKFKEIAKNQFNRLYSGVDQLFSRYPSRYISICKHPQVFSKKALLYSSLSDLLAYGTNKIQNKIDQGISSSKISKEYIIILSMIKKIFTNYSGLPSKEFKELVDNITA